MKTIISKSFLIVLFASFHFLSCIIHAQNYSTIEIIDDQINISSAENVNITISGGKAYYNNKEIASKNDLIQANGFDNAFTGSRGYITADGVLSYGAEAQNYISEEIPCKNSGMGITGGDSFN
jgi:hypothetical protein